MITVAASARFEGDRITLTTTWGGHEVHPVSEAAGQCMEHLMEQVQTMAVTALREGRLRNLTLSFDAE